MVDQELRISGRIVDARGRGVAGTQVWIDSRRVTSDSDGTFAFENLIGRSYEVRAQLGDRIGGPQVIRVTNRTERMVIELVDSPRIVVTVLDTDRAPVANASVRVIGGDPATTGTDGMATLFAHPGNHWLCAAAPGCAPRRESAAAYMGCTSRVTVIVRAGFEVRGRVVDDALSPIANARIYAHPDPDDDEPPTAITDERGTFVIPSIIGSHHILAVDDEHAPTWSRSIDIDRTITDLQIVMKPGAVYAGSVVDSDRKPVANAQVYLDTMHSFARRFFTTTDANGAFEIRGVPRAIGATDSEHDGALAYAVTTDGASADVVVKFADQVELRGQELVLERFETGEIAGVIVDDWGATIANAVINVARVLPADLSQAMLALKASHSDCLFATSTSSNTRGKFVIRNLREGEYAVWPGAFDRFPFSGPAVFALNPHLLPSIATARTGDKTVRLVWPRAGRIVGNVAFADTGELVDDYQVDVFANHEIATGIPSEHGAFEVRDPPPGDYWLLIRAGHLKAAKRGLRVEPAETLDVGTIALERGRTVTGTVVDAAGRAVAGASVRVESSGIFHGIGRFDATLDPSVTVTDARGTFVIANIPNDPMLAIGADHPSHGRSIPIAVPAEPLVLTLIPCGSLVGKLTRNGKPLVAGINAGWPPFAITTSNDAGEFAMPRLPAGDVPLRIQVFADQSDTRHQTTVHIEADKQTEIAIDVPEGTIRLTATMPANLPGAKKS